MRAGLSKCWWDGPENFIHKGGDPPLGYREFVIVSEMRKGSRDIGAQLFCAMLRSIGVTCRLICSLQVLPFTFASQEPLMKIPADATTSPDRGIGYISKTWLQNCRQNDYGARRDERGWPVYWVEAWSVGKQKWIAVDPFATKTVGKPSVIEPPVQVSGNSMSYVVGFEDDGDCTDVTRRYAQAFITKTRKARVTGTPSGEAWWDKVMAILATGAHPDRQHIEQAELTNKTLHEPIPKSLKDLKGHPLYALERHLKRDESFKILRKCGTLTTGFGKNKRTEPIYRREDVIKLRSLENWIRLGREVKLEEKTKPIKYVKAVRLPSTKLRNARSGIIESEMSGLYAESQTELCIPEPLVDGRLVKNKFGNIDLFVESMLPEGAVHLPQKNVDKAARLVGVDFAPAITDFEYRHGYAYPIATGIVVAKEYKEAIEAVHEGLVEAQDEKAARERDMRALCMWRRFVTKLRILDHVSRIPEEQEGIHHPMTMMANNQSKAVEKGVVEVVEADEEEFGGFRGGFYSVSEESEARTARKLARKSQSLKQRRRSLRASPHVTSAAKTAAKKTAESKSTTATKAKRSARKPRGRKAITKSEEEEAEESEDSNSSSFSGAQRHSHRSRGFSYKYNFDADTDSDDTAASSGGDGGFLKQQRNGAATRRSTRLATTAKKATTVKYTLDEDEDEFELELELVRQQEVEEGEVRAQKKRRASGGFLIESDNSSSELSDAPSDLLSDAEYETLIRGRPIYSNPTLEKENHDSGGFFTEGLEKRDDEGDDGDDEDEGDDVESRGVVDTLETLRESHNGGHLDEADSVMHGAGPVAKDGAVYTAKTGQGMAAVSGNDHNDNDIAVGKSFPVKNKAEGAETVAGAAALLGALGMAGPEKTHCEEQSPTSDSGPMLSEDPEDKDNADLDWCNYE
ncbi:Rad4-domain-containing protein [Tuber magnatum]|uniref:Rad4-domain-containing protein n=1 Tax=Tuber magnatum TaxID=42249 RepID=A0A317T213_9PEZI|nr:Rad4-domain-containing protein [Tuber magnatum]